MQTKIKFKKRAFAKPVIYTLIVLYMCGILFAGATDLALPSEVSYLESEIYSSGITSGENAYVDDSTSYAKLLGVLPLKEVDVSIYPDKVLIPGGENFGVKFFTKGVLVVGMDDIDTEKGSVNPAILAGISTGDILLSINEKEINTVEELAKIIENSKGQELSVTYAREDEIIKTTLLPLLSLSEKKYKTGLWVRDSTAGLGTVTYYDPQKNTFAGLGHGICDIDTGKLMPLLRGTIVDITLTDIVKGRSGAPGELKGSFGIVKKGELYKNTNTGVYGIYDSIPEKQALPIGLKNDAQKGDAQIMCTLDDEGAKSYNIQIERIIRDSDTKNFILKITDEELLSKTGGIVQGMSGSPILQNGKLIGAVTHVFVNDPTRGYGIFIENMLSEAEK